MRFKYVIFSKTFRGSHDMYTPVLIPEFATHASIKIDEDGQEAFSAGFCVLSDGRLHVISEQSTSLKIGNSDYDTTLLNNMMLGFPVSCFIYNLNKRTKWKKTKKFYQK